MAHGCSVRLHASMSYIESESRVYTSSNCTPLTPIVSTSSVKTPGSLSIVHQSVMGGAGFGSRVLPGFGERVNGMGSEQKAPEVSARI